MIYEDIVECEGCGTEITHLVCGRLDRNSDPDYRVCQSCVEQRDEAMEVEEPDTDDTVNACPNCDRPQQFAGLCNQCEREADDDSQSFQDAGEAAAHLNGSWG